MSHILTKEEINSGVANAVISGTTLIHKYDVKPTANGGNMIVGTMESKSGSFPFKAWDSSSAFAQLQDKKKFEGAVCDVEGKINEYNGLKSIIINCVKQANPAEFSPEMFMQDVYDINELRTEFSDIINTNCSAEAIRCLNAVLGPINERFKEEYCAVSHHDACRHGLYAHSLKVTKLASIIETYPEILKAVDKDTLFVGCALHDIGKVLEYDHGHISEEGQYSSHPSLGIQLIVPHRETIIAIKGIAFYNDLLSIIAQHSGEFGERPRTVVAYVVHLLDNLEATLTTLQERLSNCVGGEVSIEDYAHLRYKNGGGNCEQTTESTD